MEVWNKSATDSVPDQDRSKSIDGETKGVPGSARLLLHDLGKGDFSISLSKWRTANLPSRSRKHAPEAAQSSQEEVA